MSKTAVSLDDKKFKSSELKLIKEAEEFAARAHANQKRKSGEPFISHPVEVAQYLGDLKLDSEAIAAALLHDTLEDTETTPKQLSDKFGPEITGLVEGVTKLGQVDLSSVTQAETRRQDSSENIRKLLLAMSKDLRVILIKLSDRLHNLKTLRALPMADQKRIAEETLDIYAPLADRLGMGQLKGELEDLSFHYINPQAYKDIEARVKAVTKETNRYLAKLKRQIKDELEAGGVEALSIEGRQKHLYSIFKKLEKVEDIDDIHDLTAVRIIVPTEADCYKALGVIHQHYKPLIHRIKDYIAVPKPNGYQSLHTTVFALDGKITEIQIRTPQMHELAENGLAAHFFYDQWKKSKAYKGGAMAGKVPKQLEWVRKLTEIHASPDPSQDLVESLKLDLFEDRIFVFSPKGDLYDLPEGATPVDFAFTVHSDVGLRTAGATVNGKMVPLDTRLDNRDVVRIQTKKDPAPNRDWLGFVKTAAARNRIRAWFRSQDKSSNLIQGKALIDQSLKAWGLKRIEEVPKQQIKELLEGVPYKSLDDVMSAVGEGMLTVGAVLKKLFPPTERVLPRIVAKKPETATGKIIIAKQPNLSYQLGQCCKPAYPTPVIGYITRGSGVTIHRRGCANVPHDDPDRMVACHWEIKGQQTKARLRVMADNGIGLLRDITSSVSSLGINITGIKSRDLKDNKVETDLDVEILDLYILASLIKKLERLPQVTGVYRIK